MPAGEPDSAGVDARRKKVVLAAMAGRISEDVDRPLFEEATTCLRAGALRAAYIMGWISAAESLRNKFAAMAERDRQAGNVLTQVEKLEKAGGGTDSYLLVQAGKLGLVSQAELKKLGHVRDMRNLYAHPRGAGPTEQDVLAALGIVVDCVLSRPLLLRHGYANDLLADLFEGRHFLADDEEVVRGYAAGVAGRLHPDAAPYLLRKLVERFEKVSGDHELARLQRRGEWFLAGFLSELKPDLSAPGWRIIDVVKSRPAVAARLLGVPEVYRLLPRQAQGIVFGHLADPDAEGGATAPRFLRIQQARTLASAGVLEPEQLAAVRVEEAEAPYPALRDAGVPIERYVERLLGDLRSHTWDRQNLASGALSNAGPREVSRLRPDVQEQLGRNVVQAADGSAWGAQGLIERLRRSPGSWPEAFARGLLLETLVDDAGKFRPKDAWLPEALTIALSHDRAEQILATTIERVRTSEPKSKLVLIEDWEDGKNGYDSAVDSLKAVLEDPTGAPAHPELVDELVSAVQRARPPEP